MSESLKPLVRNYGTCYLEWQSNNINVNTNVLLRIYLLRLLLGGFCVKLFLLLSKKCCFMCAMLNPPEMRLDFDPVFLLLPPPPELVDVDSQMVSILSAFCRKSEHFGMFRILD